MPELPEITVFARDMQQELVGRTIAGVEVLQPKCLNLQEDEFRAALIGARIESVAAHGKWLEVKTTQGWPQIPADAGTIEGWRPSAIEGWLLLNLGMGGEILLTDREHLPNKYRLIFDLADGAVLVVNFWWLGHAHHAPDKAGHPMVSKLGPDFMSLTLDGFRSLLAGRRGGIKSFLLNQKHMAGIGNVYNQDPLFKAGLHPLRPINSLSDEQIEALWHALRQTLQQSIDLGGSAWEANLYGEKGKWDSSYFLIAYREGEPCPTCGTSVEKIKTGSTHSHICPSCQPEV